MKARIVAISVMILTAHVGWAQGTNYPKAKVSFDDFKGLVAEVETHRASRLINLDTFLKMSKEEGVIIVDSRSDCRFDRIHLKGAKHLAFTDFTQDNLKKVIPNFDTTILIYCNNNFDGNQTDFASKVAVSLAPSIMLMCTCFVRVLVVLGCSARLWGRRVFRRRRLSPHWRCS